MEVINVLILSKERENLGGVVNYLEILRSHFRRNISVTDFTIGARKAHKSSMRKILQPLMDGVLLFADVIRHRYDVIHLNPSLNKQSVLRDGFFLIILKLLGKDNILVFFHGWEEDYFDTIKKYSIYSFLFRKIFLCRKILVLASGFRSQLIQLGFDGNDIEIVTTMFNGALFSGVSRTQKSDGFRILYLSRLIVEKGPYELLEAFTELTNTREDLELVFAGDGPEFEPLKSLVKNSKLGKKVKMPGYIRSKEKVNLLVNSDLFILPTYYGEGCPVSLLEAMAAGLPIISSRVGAIPEIMEQNQNGILLNTVSKEEILKSLNFCLDNPSFLSTVAENNRTKAWGEYEASIVTRKMESYYSQLVKTA